jgi:hypothetical protein
MDPRQITRQMIQFNKSAYDNGIKGIEMMSEQNEKIVDTLLDNAVWMPAEGKKAVKDWMSAYRSGYEEFKKMVDDNYTKVEGYFE